MRQLLIIGCGVIGGSVALAAKRALPALRIVGVDHERVRSTPHFGRIFSAGIDAEDELAIADAIQASDFALLATPVRSILALLPSFEGRAVPVTDCGSTKVDVSRAGAKNPWFVPGHPMAGNSGSGLEAADVDLFQNSTWVLCPESSSQSLGAIADFVRSLGAKVQLETAAEHDQAVALTSHLPQLMASALFVLGSSGVARRVRGPGFASATRVAGGPPEMWSDIFDTNATAIANALNQMIGQFERISHELARGNSHPALTLLANARTIRDTER